MADSELDRIDPEPELVTLSTGLRVEVVRLRTRQLFRLLKILTQGAGPAVLKAGLDFTADPEKFSQSLLMLVVMSIPEAEQAAIGFIQSMCQPAGIADKPGSKLTKQEAEDNAALWERFNRDMFNPPPEDTLDLTEVIIRREAPELQSLGKRLRQTVEMFSKTGQGAGTPEPEPTPEEMSQALPVPSPSSSISSATNTAGPMSTSSPSPSAGSGSARRQHSDDASMTPAPA